MCPVEVSRGVVAAPGLTETKPIRVTEVPWAKAQSSSAALGRQLDVGLSISVMM